MKKDNKITEDDVKTAEKEIQKLVDSINLSIDKTMQDKEKEIMEV